MPPARFETEIPVSNQPQKRALDCSATEIGFCKTRANIPYIVKLNFVSEVFNHQILVTLQISNQVQLNKHTLERKGKTSNVNKIKVTTPEAQKSADGHRVKVKIILKWT